ncbi:MAG: IS5 family transposase [Planctomycetota bacterium]|jgi:IS5 family transposase
MERQNNQLSFLDQLTDNLGGKRTAEFLRKCDKYIPWNELAEPLKDMYANNTNKGGASNWPVVMMIKYMMLQRWFNLSDPMLEEMLLDRLSFRRFIGLRTEDKTPNETTFVVFRKCLCQHGHTATLFDKTVKILKQRGVILKEGTCVDATIIEAPRGRKRSDRTSTKDRTASYTEKHGTIHHGFKAHIATDCNGIVKDYRFDTPGVHDSRHIDDLITDEHHSVWADSAYMDSERKKRLQEQGIFCGIVEHRVRGQKELTVEQNWHNRLVAGIRAIVEHPFAWMKNAGYRRVRYRGLRRNGMDFALHAIIYNFKRSFSLQQVMAQRYRSA